MPLLSDAKAAATITLERAVLGGLGLIGDSGARLVRTHPPTDPYPEYERVRARGPLVPSKIGAQLSVDHAVCNTVLRDNTLGVIPIADYGYDWSGGAPDRETQIHPVEHSLLVLNPPAHTKLRKVVAPWFTPRRLRERGESIERTVAAFLDEATGRGEFDLISEFAMRMPVRVICELFDIPDPDYARLAAWGAVIGASLDGPRTMPERRGVRSAIAAMAEFFDELIAKRTADPGEDLLSTLITARPDGESLSRREIVATAGLLLVAGFETTVNLIGNGVLALLANPQAAELLRAEPQRAADVVEEVLRFDSPVQSTARIALEPITLAGTELPKDTVLLPLIGGANRDPAVFPDPNRFDPTRPNSRDHLSFSGGIHFCIGAGLARVEGEIALRELFARFPDLRRTGPISRGRSRIIRGPKTLPVRAG